MAKQKRKKKHVPNKLLRPLRALADNFIVFSIDGISSGVKSASTLQTVRISMTEHDVLTKFKHKYRFAVGSAWRDEHDKDHFTIPLRILRQLIWEMTSHRHSLAWLESMVEK